MATRSHVIIDGFALYSHWDGYPLGMVVKLYNAIEHLHHAKRDDWHSKKVPFFNAFVAANIANCEIDLKKKIGGCEFEYIIYSDAMRIDAYEIDFDGKKGLIFSGTLFEFINRYHRENRENESCFDAKDALYMTTQKMAYSDGVLVDYFTEKSYKKELAIERKNVKRFDEHNPNRKNAQNAINALKSAKVIRGAHHANV